MTFHPKTSGAALGGALGVVIVGVLNSIHGVHLDPTLNASIPALLGSAGSFVVPAPAQGGSAPPAGPTNQNPAG